MFSFVKYRKIYFIFSAILILTSLVSIFYFGLKTGIDFTGGTILEIEYKNQRPSNEQVREKLKDFNLGEFTIQPTEKNGLILRFSQKDIDEQTHQKIIQALGEIEEKRFESIGPVIGKELKEKTKIIIILSLLAMLLYIAFAFRQVSRYIKSWQYALVSVFLLAHDILITLAAFSILGYYYNVQINIPIIIALLTVVGYAINNIVVVFDRLRENLFKKIAPTFEQIGDLAIKQTLSRQINTSLTTLFPLIFIFLIGGETLKYFALTLILGIAVGTYSSIFLAIPILVSWFRFRKKESKF